MQICNYVIVCGVRPEDVCSERMSAGLCVSLMKDCSWCGNTASGDKNLSHSFSVCVWEMVVSQLLSLIPSQ